jgi:amidophosphoribosyltransferase
LGDELRHECGVAALYALDVKKYPNAAAHVPAMLLDLQNRGQLAAGVSTYDPARDQLIKTHKEVGKVAEVFRMSHPDKRAALAREYGGCAALGHTRYATTGGSDVRYAQPFERDHGRRWKWFSFAFNGTLANYPELRERLLSKQGYHFTLDTDTEIIMHSLAYALRGQKMPDLVKVMRSLSQQFDGAYVLTYLDAMGRMFVARDPRGFRPMTWALQDGLFAAANESVALRNAGFAELHVLEPGQMVIIEDGELRVERFAPRRDHARCFFEWVYFSNVASQIDGASVYRARAAGGARLAELEDQPIDDDCIVVPVPDTAKAAADAFAYHLRVPSMEGVIRNRYVGRSFIESDEGRGEVVRSKYTVLPSVLEGRRVFLIEDSVVRSTTLRSLITQLRRMGGVEEVHVRVACPAIVAPCFYGIDMSTIPELFAPKYIKGRYAGTLTDKSLSAMSKELGIDSLRYLSVDDLPRTIELSDGGLCLGCVTGKYPTDAGNRLIQVARKNARTGRRGRTY